MAIYGKDKVKMKIIDVHAHIFPEKIASKAVDSIGAFYEVDKMSGEGTTEALLNSGKQIGVSKYLVFSTATKAEQVESINRFIISECEKHSEMIGLGTMFIGFENYQDELVFLKNNSINGIKLHPDFQKFRIDDEKLYPVYDYMEKNNMLMLTHSGDYRYSFSNPEKIANIAKKFPKMNIIAAHFGGWSEWDKAIEYLNLPNVYFDTSSTFGFGGEEYAKKMIKKYDTTHFFFGTDFPMWDHKKELDRFMALGLPDKTVEDILYNNFASFYGLL